MNALLISKFAVFIPIAWVVLKLLASLQRNRRGLALLRSARTLKHTLKAGDYIKVKGQVSAPRATTEFAQQPCSLFQTRVNAEFQSKQKKPKRGMITHRPVLYRHSNDEEPLIIATDTHIVHALFHQASSIVMNPLEFTQTRLEAPNEICRLKAQPKYKTYVIKERYLALEAKIVAYGVVKEASGNSVVISGDKRQDKPPLIYNGTEAELHHAIKTQISRTKVLFWSIAVICLVLWFVFLNNLQLNSGFGGFVTAIVASVFITFGLIWLIKYWRL